MPRIGLRWTLSGFVEGALGHEVGHDLLAEVGENREKHEDGEELVLQSLERVGHFPEGESDEHCLVWS